MDLCGWALLERKEGSGAAEPGSGAHVLPWTPGWGCPCGTGAPGPPRRPHATSGEAAASGVGRGAGRHPGCRGLGPSCVPLVSSRVGQRGSGLSMSAARSEHEVSEIIDGLSEQEVSPLL